MERSRCVDMKEHIGERFGRLVIVGVVRDEKHGGNVCVCKCDCGCERTHKYYTLKAGKAKSCGCLGREMIEEAKAKKAACKKERMDKYQEMLDGWKKKRQERQMRLENAKKDAVFRKEHRRLYTVWRGMIGRCTWESHISYGNYGARGISICDEWRHDFRAFATWAMLNGYSDKLQIDRIDDNGNYEPSNCRWVTSMENNNNKQSNLWLRDADGNVKTCAEWARVRGIRYDTMKKSWRAKGYMRVEHGA